MVAALCVGRLAADGGGELHSVIADPSRGSPDESGARWPAATKSTEVDWNYRIKLLISISRDSRAYGHEALTFAGYTRLRGLGRIKVATP